MFEYEKKIILTKDEYLSIFLSMCNYSPLETQTNYYFDTEDLLMNKKGITCRIRAKDGKYKATVKNHSVAHPDCSFEVDLIEKTEFDPQIFNVFGIHYQGELVTERVIIYKDSCCKIVLDRNEYLDYTDFELEVEYSKDSERKAISLLEAIAEPLVATKQLHSIEEFLERNVHSKSKSQRFFDRLKICK